MYTEIEIKNFWNKLKKEDFFEEANLEKTKFKGQISEKGICTWLLKLNEFGIEVKRFKDLFTKMTEVTFPINITRIYDSACRTEIVFKDAKNTEYYLVLLNVLTNTNIEELKRYFILRINQRIEPLIFRTFYFEIGKKNQVVLNKISANQLGSDLSYREGTVSVKYDEEKKLEYKNSRTKTVITVKTKEIKENEKKFEETLFWAGIFTVKTEKDCYNAIPLIKFILELMPNETVTMSVAVGIDGEIYSGINIENDIVKEYISTEIVSKNEIKIIRTICQKKLKEFI